MVEILQNKNFATRLQILVEIAGQPNVQQRTIASRLGITPQAVSDYIRQLLDEGLLVTSARSGYRVSPQGVNWVLKMVSGLHDYVELVNRAITNITVCAAVAESDIQQGQAVGLKMKDGLLYATAVSGIGAKGISVSGAKPGEDVDITDIEGLVQLERGKITVLQVPAIQKGGSKQTDAKKLKALVKGHDQVGAIGIEALVALRKAGIEPAYRYGVTEAAVEASKCGLAFLIVCTETDVARLVKRLEEEGLEYSLKDLARRD